MVRDLVGSGQSQPPSTPTPPTVATAAHIVSRTNTTVSLAVLGADAAGEASLKYTWSLLGSAAGPVYANVNGSNAAKNLTATFTAAGVYTFQVTITDPAGLSVTSQVSVTVQQVLSRITVTPGSVSLAAGRTQQFAATEWDQFGHPLTSPQKVTWSFVSGGHNTLTSLGLFTASATPGSVLVQASAAGIRGTAVVTIQSSPVSATYSTIAALLDVAAHHTLWW